MKSFVDVWDLVKANLEKKITSVAFETWIGCIVPSQMKGANVFLDVPTDFQKNIIEEKYGALLSETFEEVMGFEINITIGSKEDAEPYQSSDIMNDSENLMAPVFRQGSVENEYIYTFDNFIVGSSNKFAHAASLAVAANPSGSYNPLFIYGGSGLGKTHLLYAICNEILKNDSKTVIIFVKGEDFTNEMIDAIENRKTQEFKNKYRTADVLLIDDIQFIAGKERTQEEFFHTFNTLYQAGKQIVLTSDRPPKEIKTLEDRLRTRFEWGLLADIQPPDFETRVAIVRRKANRLNIDLPDDVIEFISNKLKSNVRQLEGVVKKLKAYQDLTNTSSSINTAQNAIKDILSDNQPLPLTVEKIIEEVSRTFGVTTEDIISLKRSSNISNARQVAIYTVRAITQMSMVDIGKEFGNRDHSTIVYTLKTADKKMAKNPQYKATIDDIISNIKNS